MKRSFQQFILCTALLLPGLISAQPAGTIIIDNADAHFEGSWTKQKTSTDRYGDDYRFSSTNERGGSTATYNFQVRDPGKYNVEIMYPQGGNRARAAQWVISHEGGEKTVTANQQINGGKWTPIATEVPFAAGSYYVQLSNTGPTNSIVVADAVRIVPLAAIEKPGFTLNAVAAVGGKLTKSPDLTSFEPNSEVILTARASEGYVFDGWSGDATGYKNPLRIVMDGNKTVTANFIAAGIGVIMDNPMARFEPADKWQLSSTNWPGTRYEDYQFASAKATAEAHGYYTPNIPRSGKYDVYIWYAQGANRSTKVPWSVVHKGGTVQTNINQQTNGGQWVQIASAVEFEAGKKDKQYVEVNNGTGSEVAGTVIIADAVAFVYISD